MATGAEKKLGVLILHGMGDQSAGFSDELRNPTIAEIDSILPGRSGDIAWQEGLWATEAQVNEVEMWKRFQDARLHFTLLRKYVLYYLGDVIAYLNQIHGGTSIYSNIHRLMHRQLGQLRESLGGDKPLVVIAHSLGSSIITDYLRDRQGELASGNGTVPPGHSAFTMGMTLCGMVTSGCTMPVMLLGQRSFETIPCPAPGFFPYFQAAATPPGPSEPDVRQSARWINIYDQDDVLGYPLAPLGNQFAAVQDIVLDAGFDDGSRGFEAVLSKLRNLDLPSALVDWSPISHRTYWSRRVFIQHTGKFLADLLRLL